MCTSYTDLRARWMTRPVIYFKNVFSGRTGKSSKYSTKENSTGSPLTILSDGKGLLTYYVDRKSKGNAKQAKIPKGKKSGRSKKRITDKYLKLKERWKRYRKNDE